MLENRWFPPEIAPESGWKTMEKHRPGWGRGGLAPSTAPCPEIRCPQGSFVNLLRESTFYRAVDETS